jgi:hypothetical protein
MAGIRRVSLLRLCQYSPDNHSIAYCVARDGGKQRKLTSSEKPSALPRTATDRARALGHSAQV